MSHGSERSELGWDGRTVVEEMAQLSWLRSDSWTWKVTHLCRYNVEDGLSSDEGSVERSEYIEIAMLILQKSSKKHQPLD